MADLRPGFELPAAIVAGALLWMTCIHGHAQQKSGPAQQHDRARVSIATALPKLDGEHLRATLVESTTDREKLLHPTAIPVPSWATWCKVRFARR